MDSNDKESELIWPMEFWLYGCRLQTISKFDDLQSLTTIEAEKFWQTIKALRGRTDCFGRRPLVTYRGVSREHLVEKLSSDTQQMTEAIMLSYLFYFGDKAKHFYKYNDSQAMALRWLKEIEDTSNSTNRKMFTKIAKVLNHSRNEVMSDFISSSPEFYRFFRTAINRNDFADVLCELGPAARDYYFCFLHTVGNIGLGNKSVLVSTTRSYEKAIEFAGDNDQSFVIWYVIPRPIDNYAVSAAQEA